MLKFNIFKRIVSLCFYFSNITLKIGKVKKILEQFYVFDVKYHYLHTFATQNDKFRNYRINSLFGRVKTLMQYEIEDING